MGRVQVISTQLFTIQSGLITQGRPRVSGQNASDEVRS